MTVVNDRKIPRDVDPDGAADFFFPTIMSATDYYAFGFEMPGRTYNQSDYRYGFNGKEFDRNGEFSSLNHYDYGFRIYNPGIGRFLSVDPLTRSYPWYTPYQFAGNKPIWAVDLDGLEEYYSTEGKYLKTYYGSKEMRIIDEDMFDYISSIDDIEFRDQALLFKSYRAYEDNFENEKNILKAWAHQYKNAEKEYAMSLFRGEIELKDGSGSLSVFVEGSLAEGLTKDEARKIGASASGAVDPSLSKGPDGWKRSATIHNHPTSRTWKEFSNTPSRNYGFSSDSGGDIQWSLSNFIVIYMVPKGGYEMGRFDPQDYVDYVKQKMIRDNGRYDADFKLKYPPLGFYGDYWIAPHTEPEKSIIREDLIERIYIGDN
ncbi:MAG TPA: RHS repeat-associated core domain-containing protein [Ignavibacteria bacterium]|nr:RHS repeat-associated core domain-containing protein [Ignavibacteria bacterium]